MSDIESSKQGKGRKRLSGDENKWLNGYDDRRSIEKKKELWRAIRKSTNSEASVLLKNGYRLITKMSATFNRLSIFAFCVYTSRSSSTYTIGRFYLHFKYVILYLFPLSL